MTPGRVAVVRHPVMTAGSPPPPAASRATIAGRILTASDHRMIPGRRAAQLVLKLTGAAAAQTATGIRMIRAGEQAPLPQQKQGRTG